MLVKKPFFRGSRKVFSPWHVLQVSHPGGIAPTSAAFAHPTSRVDLMKRALNPSAGARNVGVRLALQNFQRDVARSDNHVVKIPE
jgi:hypothetical protein